MFVLVASLVSSFSAGSIQYPANTSANNSKMTANVEGSYFSDESHGQITQITVTVGDIIAGMEVIYSDGKTMVHGSPGDGNKLDPWSPQGRIVSGEIYYSKHGICDNDHCALGLRLTDEKGNNSPEMKGSDSISDSTVLQPGTYKYFTGVAGKYLDDLQMPYAPPPAPCTATDVKGHWEYQFTVAGATTQKWSHGTHKTESNTKTQAWDESVTTTVSQGFSLVGNGGSVQISGTVAHQTSQTFQSEWGTSDTQEFDVTFDKSDVGKAAWQFVFSPTDSCGNAVTSLTKEFALTEGQFRQPCCVPGWATDAPAYKSCSTQDAMIANGEAEGCKVG